MKKKKVFEKRTVMTFESRMMKEGKKEKNKEGRKEGYWNERRKYWEEGRRVKEEEIEKERRKQKNIDRKEGVWKKDGLWEKRKERIGRIEGLKKELRGRKEGKWRWKQLKRNEERKKCKRMKDLGEKRKERKDWERKHK